ncbi:uncharacterized protein TOT_020000328 [Theileria orientalis strain Shintoku]|uniref:ABC transporter n=1 Tax=Theileria orientalis strain Shintoku TaxID=869250 RepID=J4DP44_THEOR|nr:uncharacterized protein TOT_020000328 [Theileria orientalis strain Shintoku]BAM40064.1 uncharacterized protein TOT_020000328 [Theileria orientalis strain Shintoku]|eukprot:XP_009690365.1 uncharacterized protein TOT_020000328 [Theileria orientalis strain Shintoku]
MNKPSRDNLDHPKFEPESCFWDSEPYFKSYFKGIQNKTFKYYDDSNVLKYLFFHWVNRWVSVLSRKYLEPYKLHPVQISDQILKWEPIFSKHVSDGLARLDHYETTKSTKNPVKPYNMILLRAILLTIWKRSVALLLGLIIVNVLSMSISILVEKLIQIVLDGVINENVNYYVYRMIFLLNYLYGIVPFRHALTHRRVYYNNVNGSNQLNTCNEVLHSCSPDSPCSKNPLFCPALRYHNKDVDPKIFTYVFYDSFYIAMAFESTKFIVQFLTNFIYGVYLMSRHVKANIWVLYLTGALFLLFMVTVEIFNAVIFKYILYMRDYKVTKYKNILGALTNIKKMFCDDIGFNIITQTRNNELSLIFVKIFITFINMCVFSTSINISFYIIKMYFVKSVNNANEITEINPAAFLVTFYIYMRIVSSMFIIPRSINIIGMAYVSYKRVNTYLKKCAPNFYNKANCFTGPTHATSELNSVTNKLPNDVVVYFKDATLTWVHSREDLMSKNYEPFLKNVNFELKRGEIAIVTGSQGTGKTNFVRAMLGDMTLVGGSMAVVPLHTSMPIFYASQDIYLQKGTVRSNITFGYKFDENLYNTVLKAVELQSDIGTWEKGDLRPVSDNALSLSGGQRVRVEMARALYAYLVFHKVNKEYNSRKCSFLMVLDAPFHGLDPFVSKTIFYNLFNLKNGLLVRDDLSVVLTSSKRSLDTCSRSSDVLQFPNVHIYHVKNKEMSFFNKLHDFMKTKKHEGEFKYLSTARNGPYNMNYLTNDMVDLCLSNNSKEDRADKNKELYRESFVKYIKEHFGNTRFYPFLVFMKPAAVSFTIYILLTIALNAMDYIKFILSSNLSDYIIQNINDHNNGKFVDLEKVKAHSNSALKVTVIFVTLIIITSFMATLAVSAGSLISCRKLHEYCINTIFNYSSSVVKIKKQISQIITYLSCDLMMTDDITGIFIALLLFALIQTITNIISLFYTIPITIPFIVVAMMTAYFYVLRKYIKSARTLNFGFLESLTQMNTIMERSITGAEVYRSFNRDSDLLRQFMEQRDYNARPKFLFAAVISWCAIVFTWMFSLATIIILIIPIILDKYTKYKMMVGYYGLALSLSMNVIKSFTSFSSLYAFTEQLMGSIERFQYFIPFGQKLKFDKSPNTHDEYVVNPVDNDFIIINKAQLLTRRAIEFKAVNKKFYGLRRLFYHPRLTILDSSLYLTPEHVGVELKNLCVYASQNRTPDSMILKNITVTTHRSEMICMVGRTGAGKTTLLSSLQNLPLHRTGQVLLDGKDLNEIPKAIMRQIVGVLPQHPFVFKGWTVRRFLDPRKLFTDDEINHVLIKCSLMNFVNELPGGKKLDTVITPEDPILYNSKKRSRSRVNSFGIRSSMTSQYDLLSESDMLLSYSQLRTLSFVRLVLYRNFFRVLLVDEPPEEDLMDTSAKSEDLGVPIYDLLHKYFSHCTTFVTAHDVEVLKKCNYVWVIHEGRLVKTCKTSDIKANESISKIIEESLKSA